MDMAYALQKGMEIVLLGELGGRRAALDFDHPSRVGGGRRRLEQLTDEIVEQVLERDESRGAAELIQHDGQVAPTTLHFEHQVGSAYRAGNRQRRPHQDGILWLSAEEVERVCDTDHFIQRLAVDGVTAVP